MVKNNNLFIGFTLIIIGVVGLLSGPSTHHTMMGLMQTMTEVQLPKGIRPENLPEPHSQQVGLLSKYCTQCHGLPGPGMHTKNEWPLVINRMRQYLQTMHTFHILKPSEVELTSIQNYLQQHAQIALNKSHYADIDSPVGLAFQQTCGQCHAAPDPKQHTASEWVGVVQRMLTNMKSMGVPVPDEQRVEIVTTYLQINATPSQ